MHHPTDSIAHTTAVVTPVVEHWLEREIAQWVHLTKDRSDDPSHHEQTLLPQSYISISLYSIAPLRMGRGNMLLSLHGLLFQINSKGFSIYASSHRQDSTYHDLYHTSCGAVAGTINSSIPQQWANVLPQSYVSFVPISESIINRKSGN